MARLGVLKPKGWLSTEIKGVMLKELYSASYTVFLPCAVYKGLLDAAHTVVEAWLQKRKRMRATMNNVEGCELPLQNVSRRVSVPPRHPMGASFQAQDCPAECGSHFYIHS